MVDNSQLILALGLLLCLILSLPIDVLLKVFAGKGFNLLLLRGSLTRSLLLSEENTGVPVDPILDGLVGPVALVLDGVELLVGAQEEDGGISLEWGEHVGNIVGGAVHLAEDNVLVVLEHLLGNLFVDWVELLAMSAPGGVEEHDGVFLDLVYLRVVVIGDNLFDVALLLLGHGHGLHVGPDLASPEILNKLGQVVCLEIFDGLHPELLLLGEAADVDVLATVLESERFDLILKLFFVADGEFEVGSHKSLGGLDNLLADVLSVLDVVVVIVDIVVNDNQGPLGVLEHVCLGPLSDQRHGVLLNELDDLLVGG